MKLGIPRETGQGETRVAVAPESVKRLAKLGLEILVEKGAGAASFFADGDYESAGAAVVAGPAELFQQADLIVKIAAPTDEELARLGAGKALVALLNPLFQPDLAGKLAATGATSFSLDMLPRISRAQSMDVLSSMSTLAGYKAVLLAADALRKIVPMMMTAAGTIQPARALIIGAGVAGLQAIATAKRLGAQVKGVDTRPAVKEQVESLGAKFIALEVAHEQAETAGGYAKDLGEEFYMGEQEILAPHVAESDMIVTTAMIPGRRAPVLITEKMVESMKPGSAIVDLAASAGGNCTLTRPGETVERAGVKVFGPANLAGEVSIHASQMFSRNVAAFLAEIVKDGALVTDAGNEIVAGTLITRDGKIVHPDVAKAAGNG